MSSFYDPPGHESEHMQNHYEVVHAQDKDRVWKGVVLGILCHLFQPTIVFYIVATFWESDFKWALMPLSQTLYMIPAMFLAYRIWGLRAFRGTVYVLLSTVVIVYGAIFVWILFESVT